MLMLSGNMCGGEEGVPYLCLRVIIFLSSSLLLQAIPP